jgi:prophage antirepressor-like protein
MHNAPTPFVFEDEHLVRVVRCDGDDGPRFVAADICRILELTNPSKAIEGLEEDEVAAHTLTSGEGTPGNIVKLRGRREAGKHLAKVYAKAGLILNISPTPDQGELDLGDDSKAA